MSKKILTLREQKHIWSTLTETFSGLTQQEKYDIIKALGLDGVIGEDGEYIPFYSIDIHSSRPTYITNQFDTKLTANLFNYTENVSSDVTKWKWERVSGNPIEDQNWAVGKNTRELNLTYADFTERFTVEQDIIFRVSATIKGKTITDEIIFSKILYFSKVQIVSDKNVFVETTPEKIRLSFTTDIVVDSIRWYIDNNFLSASESFELGYNFIPLGGSATIKLEVEEEVTGKVFTDSLTIPRLSVGTDGEPGVPGEPGTNSYTWIKYSNDPQGLNMSEYPIDELTGIPREYIGMAPNKNTPTESNNPADYTWTKYIGDQGVPGENGYMWIKYSIYSDGRDPSGDVEMFDTPFIIKPNGEREDMVYMGIAYNKQTQQEADPYTSEGAPEVYTWAKIKGEDGRTPYTLDLSNDNVSIPANSSGATGSTAFNLAKTDIKLYYGNDVIDPSEYTLSFIPTNVTYVLSNNNHHLQITGMTGSVGEVKIEARANNKLLTTATFSVVKVVGTATYEILPSTSVIKIVNNYTGGDQEIQPTSIEVKIKKNTGESVDTVYEGRLTYRYIYASTVGTDDDGANIPIDQVLEIDNSGNPLFLEFKYFHPVTNAMVDRETIPFVRDGVSANTTELRFRVTDTSTIIPPLDKLNPNPPDWTVTQPTVPSGHVLWMTRAVKKANGDLIGQWSDPIIFIGLPGAPGSDGPQGPPGMSGTTGPSPRTFEWLPGAQYQVGEGFIDYAYYRGTGVGDPCLGWYVVKLDPGKTMADYNTTAKKVIANATGCPDPNLFTKAPFSGSMTFSTIIAEQANLAGFLFRNQILESQNKSYQSCTNVNDKGPFPNLIINGIDGIFKFLERIQLDKNGLTLKDDCGKNRLTINYDSRGIPVIQFYYENGSPGYGLDQDGPYNAVTPTSNSNFFVLKGQMYVNGAIPSDIFRKIACNCNGVINVFGDYARANNIIGYHYLPRSGSSSDPNTGKVFTQPDISSPVVAAGNYITNIKDIGGGYYEIAAHQVNSEGKAYNIIRTEVHSSEIGTTYPVYNCGVANTPAC